MACSVSVLLVLISDPFTTVWVTLCLSSIHILPLHLSEEIGLPRAKVWASCGMKNQVSVRGNIIYEAVKGFQSVLFLYSWMICNFHGQYQLHVRYMTVEDDLYILSQTSNFFYFSFSYTHDCRPPPVSIHNYTTSSVRIGWFILISCRR